MRPIKNTLVPRKTLDGLLTEDVLADIRAYVRRVCDDDQASHAPNMLLHQFNIVELEGTR